MLIKNTEIKVTEVKKFTPSSTKKNNEDQIYSKRSAELDIIENDDNFLLFSINDKYDLGPNLNDQNTKDEITELVYQKDRFDLNRSVLEDIQKREFNNNKFTEMAAKELFFISLQYL